MVRRLNIDGDGQGDSTGHGGERRAVFVYQIESYHYWQSQLGRTGYEYGQFGENFTVEGLADDEVCIGDRYRIGGAVFEVTQPRVTCYRVGIRMNEPRMAALLVAHDRPGFYFRVLKEGEVEVGDEIVRLVQGPESMTVREVNALLYKPGHPADRLEKALRIPALSATWRPSFQALLEQARQGGGAGGNPGLGPVAGPPPAWAGFRPLRVSDKTRESGSVTSLVLESTNGQPLPPPLPGQFVVLRLHPTPDAPPQLRSYSLSGDPGADRYRVSVKRNPGSAAGAYISDAIRIGDVAEAAAPRGNFVLKPGDDPVVLLSAGVGATPVLAMLHALAAAASPREVWWIHGAQDGGEHPFAEEVRARLKTLPHTHSHIRYSAPSPTDRPAVDFDAPGRVSASILQELGVPREADFYLCGPPPFMTDLTAGLAAWGRNGEARLQRDVRNGSRPDSGNRRNPGQAAASAGRFRRRRAARVLRTQWPQYPVGIGIPEHPRTGRGVRRPRAMGVSNRRLSQLRELAHRRRRHLSARSARPAGRRSSADLLL